MVYDASEVWGGGLKNAIVNWINGVRPDSWNENRLPASSTFAVAQRHFYWLQESDLLSPDREQRIAAERMFGDDRERTPERHVLFSANPSFDEALTAAVQEKWISAWLYLRHRLESGDTSEGLRTEFRIVSRHLDSALISSDNARHVSLRALARSMRNLGANVNGKGRPKVTSDLVRVLDEVRSLKSSAKSGRDKGEWSEALDDLNEAIVMLREIDGTENARGSKHLLDAELADTFGQVGGIERRWAMASTDADQRSEHLERSKAAYDRGFELEQQLPRDAMEATSYNRINRLVARVLLQPQVLNGLNFDSVEVLGELHVAEDILNYRMRGSGQRDPCLYCDVGTINLLRGTDWLPTVQQLEKLRPPQFVYSSWLSTLTTINAVASSVRPELQDAIRLLERAARYAR